MKRINEWYFIQNVYFKFLPFLFLYLLNCCLFSQNNFIGDEFRYVSFANNLLHGFYSSPYPNINLWNGPGYPVILMPFVFFKLPYLIFRIFNAFLLYFSLIITFKTCRTFSSPKNATLVSILLALYYPIYGDALLILTETFSWFLISLICFLTIKCFQQKFFSLRLVLLTAFTIAYLAMTKVIFGYIICVMLLLSLVMFLSAGYRKYAKQTFMLFLISFVFCLPWLLYTYNLTNKFFYWTNSGGMSLYTMSTPYKNELGDWDILGESISHPNHNFFIDSISKLTPLQKDDAFKQKAIINIKQNPQKYFSNWLANLGRMFFSMPFTNKAQSIRMYLLIIPNMIIIVLLAFVFAISLFKHIKYPIAIQILTIFLIMYLLGSSFISAYKRMFYITMPFWFVLIGFFFSNVVEVRIKDRD